MASPTTHGKAVAIHSLVQGGTFSTPPTPSHAALASILKTAGVLKVDGTYATGKGQVDVERTLQVPEIQQDIAMRHAVALGV